MPQNVASDLGLHCLPVTFSRVSRLKWVEGKFYCLSERTLTIIRVGMVKYVLCRSHFEGLCIYECQ